MRKLVITLLVLGVVAVFAAVNVAVAFPLTPDGLKHTWELILVAAGAACFAVAWFVWHRGHARTAG